MTARKILSVAGLAACLMTASAASAATILFEDFEDAAVTYTSSVADDLSDIANRDFYGRAAAGDLPAPLSYSNVQGGSFYVAEDTDGASNSVDQIELNYTGIDVSTFTNLNLSFYLAEDDEGSNEDWDGDTSFFVDYRLDGGSFVRGFAVEAANGNGFFNNAPRVDTNGDGVGDGTEITDSFAQFDFDIGDANTLDLRFTFLELTAQDEDLALDNILLSGDAVAAVPLPAGVWLMGMALGGLGLARRRS